MNISRNIRRILTGLLCFAMVATAIPETVLAAGITVQDEIAVDDMTGADGDILYLDDPSEGDPYISEKDDTAAGEDDDLTGAGADDDGLSLYIDETDDPYADETDIDGDIDDDSYINADGLEISDLEEEIIEPVGRDWQGTLYGGEKNAEDLKDNAYYYIDGSATIIIPDGCDKTIESFDVIGSGFVLTFKCTGNGTGKLTFTEGIKTYQGNGQYTVKIEGGVIKCPEITCKGNLMISGGTADIGYTNAGVTISGGDCRFDQISSTNGDVKVTGGNLYAKRICPNGDFIMQGGRVYAFTDETSIYGPISANNISVSGGILNAISNNTFQALRTDGALTVTGGIVRAESVCEAAECTSYQGYAVKANDCAINSNAYFIARSNVEAIWCDYGQEIDVSGMRMTEISTGGTVSLEPEHKRTLVNSDNGRVRDVLIENASNTHAIELDQTTLAFAETEYSSAPPAAETITVTNTGTGPVRLTGIISNKADSEYTVSDIEGAISLTGENGVFLLPTRTATFTVRPNEMLAAGDHNETFTVMTDDDEVYASADATFTVIPTNYKIEATNKDATVDFGTYRRDYLGNYNKAPETKTVTIKNTGQGAVTVLTTLPTDITDVFNIVFPTELDLDEGDSLNITVTPRTGLTGGDYDTVLYVKTSKGVQAAVNLKFKIKDYDYTIAADKTTLSFGRKNEGYVTPPAALNLKITNKGEKNVTIKDLSVLSEKYDITPSGDQTVAPKKSVTYKIRPKTGLTRGHGNDTITIETYEGSTPVNIDLKFDVGQYLSGTVNASDLADNGQYTIVGDTIINITAGDDKTIKSIESDNKCYNLTIAGNDAGKLTVTGRIIHNYYTTDGRAAKKLKITGGTLITTEIYEGSDVEITGGIISGKTLSTMGSLTVSGGVVNERNNTSNPSSISGLDITITGGKVFAHNDEQGAGIIANRNFVVTGGYVEAVASSSSPAEDWDCDGVGLYGSQEVTIGGDAYVIAKGTKEAVVCKFYPINADGMTVTDLESYDYATVATDEAHYGHFVVVDEEHPDVIVKPVITKVQIEKAGLDFNNDYTFSLSPSKLDFGTMIKGCTIPEAQTVLITNTGRATLVFKKIESAVFDILQPSDLVLMPGESASFTIRPKDTLTESIADQPISVAIEGKELTVTASVEVVEPVYSITATPATIDFGTFAKGYIAEGVPAQTITLTNTGNVTVELDPDPTKTYAPEPFVLGELSTYTLAPHESMTVPVTIEDGTVIDSNELLTACFESTTLTGSAYDDVNLSYKIVEPGVDGLWIESIPDQTYNGTAIKPEVNVYYRGMKLTSKDYTVSYKNNTNAYTLTESDAGFDASKAPTVTIKGKSNYAGTATANFVIEPLDIINADAPDMLLAYNSAKAQFGKTKVTYLLNGKTVTLKENRDFKYVWEAGKNYKDPGTYTTTIAGMGNYARVSTDKTYKQTIITSDQVLISSLSMPAIPDQAYSGKEIRLKTSDDQADPAQDDDWIWAKTKTGTSYQFLLKDPKTKAVLNCGTGKDYTLSIEDNRATGTATVTVTGTGTKYVGTRTLKFKINGMKLSAMSTEGYAKEILYTGSPRLQPMRFYYTTGKGKTAVKHYLTEGVNYTADYTANTEIGTATVVYTGRDPYVGTVTKTYKIKGMEMKNVRIPSSFAATTGKFESGIPVSYTDEHCYNAKTNSFIYTGLPFEVAGPANAESAADNAGIQLQYYDKKTDTSTDYVNGEDYFVTYAKNVLPGTATVTFTGKGRLTGSVKKTFKISAYDIKNDPAHRIFITRQDGGQIDETPYVYTKGGVKPDPKVKYVFKSISKVLEPGTDYTLKWSNNDAITTETTKNKPTVTITGKAAFAGTRLENYRITGNHLEARTTNTATVDCTTTDVIYQEKVGICKTTLTLTDKTTHVKLVPGTDYDKNLIYRYESATDVRTREKVGNKYVISAGTIPRGENEKVDMTKDVIPVGTWITVSVIPLAKGKYNVSTAEEKVGRFRFIDQEKDISKMSITINPYTYDGQPVVLTSDHIVFKYGKNVINPAYDPADEEHSDYRIEYIGSGYTNKGTYKVKIVGNPKQGYTNSKTVSFTVKARTMDYTINYDTAMNTLAEALSEKYPEHNALWYQSNYRIVGTPTTSVTAKGAALPKFTYTVQKWTGDKWVKDNAMQSKIVFAGWKIDTSDSIVNNQGKFYPPLIAVFLYGDSHTLYAQWTVK